MRSHRFAPRFVTRGRLPTPRDSVTPLPPATLCRPTSGVWQDDSRALALLTLPGEKRLLWAAVSCESLPQPTRHSLGTLWCVSHGTPDSDCPWHTLRPLGLGSCTPAWAKHFLKPPLLQTLLSLLKTFPAESGESFSDLLPTSWCGCPARGLTRRVHVKPSSVLAPRSGPPLRDHSVIFRLSCQRVLKYTWASEDFKKTRRTAADVATVQPRRRHTSGRRTVGRNMPKCEYHSHTNHHTHNNQVPPARICAVRRLPRDVSARSPDRSDRCFLDTGGRLSALPFGQCPLASVRRVCLRCRHRRSSVRPLGPDRSVATFSWVLEVPCLLSWPLGL